jgi:CxxC motif-containing protein (DUF1111 family)
MRFLAPIDRAPLTAEARQGESLFREIGCVACHTPALATSPNVNPVFDRKTVPLYSDLLLHDVGTGDGIEQAAAEAGEIRTPPLWGLRLRRPLLHDGSSPTIEDAIRRHAGEAEKIISRFRELPPADRAALLSFLKSL